MSQDTGNDMRLDDSEAKSGSGTSPSNGGGSQDSIDSILEDYRRAISDPKMITTEQAKAAILAWHNRAAYHEILTLIGEDEDDDRFKNLDAIARNRLKAELRAAAAKYGKT